MKTNPIYKKTFSRDFTLVSMEIWWRGEVISDKLWTKAGQPFLPYIVFEKIGDTVNSYYDERGILGTKIATRALKDGDLVEVDANNGVVKILKRS